MKILTLSFYNLNSLKGHWHINFSILCPNDGIFAILGQTGAGKTTILDAICLAIYGRTPRLKTISTEHNDIMSKNTGECSATVEIAINHKLYRFFWGQHRANKKPNGKLQPIRREICQILHVGDTGTLIESKTKLCESYACDLMTMNFEQFTRSVMLAQGEFSAFLKADTNDKGEILEQITGTEIYGEISKKAHAVEKQKKEQLTTLKNSLNCVNLLSPEEFLVIKTAIDTQTCAVNEHKIALEHIETAIKLLESHQQLCQELTNAQQILTQKQHAFNEFAPSIAHLHDANNAFKVEPAYQHWQNTTTHHQAINDQFQHLKKQLKHTQHAINDQNALVATSLATLKQAQSQYDDALPLFNQIKHLDTNIQQISFAKTTLASTVAQNQNILVELTHTIDDLNNKITTTQTHYTDIANTPLFAKNSLTQELATLTRWYGALSHAIEKLTHSHQQQTQHQKVSQDLKIALNENALAQNTAQKMCLTHQEQITESYHTATSLLTHSLLATPDNLNPPPKKFDTLLDILSSHDELLTTTANDIATQIRHLDILVIYSEHYTKLTTTLTHLKNTATQINNQRTDLEAIIHTDTQKLTDQQRTLSHLHRTYTLEQENNTLKALFNTLTHGSPCPVCGSKVHPYEHAHPILSDTPSTLEQDIATLSEQINTLTDTLNTHHAKLNALQISLASTYDHYRHSDQERQQLVQKSTPLLTKLPTLSHINSPSIDITQLAQTKKIDECRHFWQTSKHTLDTLIDRYTDCKNTLNTAIIAYQNSQNTLYQHQKAHQKLADQYQTLQTTLQTLTDEYHKNRQTVISYIDTLNVELATQGLSTLGLAKDFTDNRSLNILNDHIQTLTHAHQQRETLLEQYQQQKQHHTTYVAQRDTLIQQLTTLQQKQQQDTQTLHTLTQQLITLQQQRKHLFGDVSVEATQEQLYTILQNAHADHAKHTQTLGEYHAIYQTLNRQYTEQKRQLTHLDQQIKQAQEHFDQAMHQYAFKTLEQFLQARLLLEQREQLNTTHQTLSQDLKHAQDAVNALQEKLSTFTSMHRSLLDSHTLQTLLDDKQHAQHSLETALCLLGEYTQQHKNAQHAQQHSYAVSQKISQLEEDLYIWTKLNTLIGSHDGKMYRNFVQGLTLNVLLTYANQMLKKMTERYILYHDNTTKPMLEISVIDTHQANEIRSTKNLSGGESFIVSLALAMGLSMMNSHHMSIDSLFLDEGFGTLDEEVLDIALSVLSTLHENGKMIGIISHVTTLKERISTQLVVKKTLGGNSKLIGNGVSYQDKI